MLTGGLSLILISGARSQQVTVQEGRPAPDDVVAPRDIVYESAVQTENERQRAAQAVQPVYTSADPLVRQQQEELLRLVFARIDAVRSSAELTPSQKLARLRALPGFEELSDDQGGVLLGIEEPGWLAVQAESLRLLRSLMRSQIATEAQLRDVRSRLPPAVSPTFDDRSHTLITFLVRLHLVANSVEDEEATRVQRQEARESVVPVTRRILAGQSIVRAGELVDAEDVEALEHLGLLHSRRGRFDSLGALLLMIALVPATGALLYRLRPDTWQERGQLVLAATLVLLLAAVARGMIPGHVALRYAFPAAAVPMLLTLTLGVEYGLASAFLLSIVAGALGGSLELMIYALTGSLVAAASAWRARRFSALASTGLWVALANMLVISGVSLQGSSVDARGLAELAALAVVNAGLTVSLSAAGYFIAGSVFGLTTSLQLMELARPDHSLLRDLQTKAPGTYHHSLLISNLAEAAAEAVGADGLLARVSAYYHDVGKLPRPYFFIENQMGGNNVHDNLDPRTSAQLIISHVAEGDRLAAEHGLPQRIRDVILQHHGTTQVGYFYQKGLELHGEGGINMRDFTYPGPKPQTRVAAIMMIADACEAAVRAANPTERAEIDAIVARVIRRRIAEGQLDECDLTLRDLRLARGALVRVLHGLYHPRLRYPEASLEPEGAVE
jgi:hypothetical protein